MKTLRSKFSLIRSVGQILLVAGVAGMAATPSWADLTGTTVYGSAFYNDDPTSYNLFDRSSLPCSEVGCTTSPIATIGTSTEFAYFTHDDSDIADFTATTLTVSFGPYFTFDPRLPFGPLTFEFKDDAFVGATLSLLSFKRFASADKFTYSLSADTITVRVPEYFITYGYGDDYAITLGIAAVPEASTTLTMLAGLLLMAYGARRQSIRPAPADAIRG